MKPGTVALVGAGPGAHDLLTLRARRCLEEADVVLYDALVDPRALEDVRADAELVFVGKRGGAREREARQSEINARMVDEARKGRRVVRLKGGDPFVFGRGGEEALVLAEAGVPFVVVPGVSSPVAVPGSAGIPITHRGLASSFAVVTGREAPGAEGSIDWEALARVDTVVVLMARQAVREACVRLVEAGRAPTEPAACIARGTLADQRVVTASLAELPDAVEAAALPRPALLVVGEVVGLRATIEWFEKRPLFGRTIVVTRPEGSAASLREELEANGARVLLAPAIEIAPPADPAPLREILESPSGWDWIVFTSRPAVERFFGALIEKAGDVRAIGAARLAAIGPATSEALRERGLRVDVVPEEYLGESLAAALVSRIRGARCLVPRAEGARAVLVEKLSESAAEVREVFTHRAAPAERLPDDAASALAAGEVDAVTFTSSSTVGAFAALLSARSLSPDDVPAAVIGPITAASARQAGFRVVAEAAKFTASGLARSLVDSLGGGR